MAQAQTNSPQAQSSPEESLDLREQVFNNLELDKADFPEQGDKELGGIEPKEIEPAAEGGAPAQDEAVSESPDELEQLFGEQQQQPGPPARYDRDKKGNILDPKTGNVIARAGAEARLYVDARNARVAAHQAGLERDRMQGNLREALGFVEQFRAENHALREVNRAAERLGVTPQESAAAVELVSKLKQGGSVAVQALKEILTRAHTAGIDITSLGVASGALDTKTIVDLIDQRFKPIKDTLLGQQQARDQQIRIQQEEQQRFRAAADHTVGFFQANPDATPYAPAIEKMLRSPQFSGWSLREVWQAIQLHLSKRGSQPGVLQNNGNGQTQQPQSNHREIPRGRPQVDLSFDANRPAPVSMSYEDIVNEVLNASGMPR